MNVKGLRWLAVVVWVWAGLTHGACENAAVPGEEAADDGAGRKVDEQAVELLERIEKRAGEITSFEAAMRYELRQLLMDVVKVHNGRIYYLVKDNVVSFRIHFGDWLEWDIGDDPPAQARPYDEDYAFDGRWLTRRNGKFKTLQRQEIARKAKGPDDFRLGQGPFPLPFAIRKWDVLSQFEVVWQADKNEDREMLSLVPHEGGVFFEQYERVELWFRRADAVPVRIRTVSRDHEVTIVTWSDININGDIGEDIFRLSPTGEGWTVEETPLGDEKGEE